MQERPDFASPHALTLDVPEAVPFYDYQRFGVGPNGAVNSSVNDMLKYLTFYLEGGTVSGKRLLSEDAFRQLWKPVSVVNDRTTYALGWQIGTVADMKLVTHAGAITGFTGYMALVPEKKIGVVVLNNLGSNLPSSSGMKSSTRWSGTSTRTGSMPTPRSWPISTVRKPTFRVRLDRPPPRIRSTTESRILRASSRTRHSEQ